jgi:hypothetical protein
MKLAEFDLGARAHFVMEDAFEDEVRLQALSLDVAWGIVLLMLRKGEI